jgi:anti-sigma factor RsiW
MHKKNKKCVSEQEIGAYIDGRLSSDLKDAVDKRLTECKQCWEEFAAISQYVVQKENTPDEEVPAYMILPRFLLLR